LFPLPGQRGVCYRKLGNTDECIQDLSDAIERDPNCEAYYFNRGLAHFDKGEIQEALEDYSSAVKISPRSFRALFNRASCWHRLGDVDKALDDYKAACESSPKFDDSSRSITASYFALRFFWLRVRFSLF
jgi:tetratricopeptide (TPR) repeat protein